MTSSVSGPNPQRILFIRTDRLGEVLLNLPALVALRQAYPRAHLAMMTSPELRALLEGVPDIDQLLEYRDDRTRPWWMSAVALAGGLRDQQFDLAVISNAKKAFHLAAALAGIPIRVGYNRKWGWLLTHRVEDRKALGERHEVEYNLDLIQRLGLPREVPSWQLPHFEPEQRDVLQQLRRQGIQPSEPLIAVHPWTSHPLKQWPADRFRQLIQRVAKTLPVKVVVIGGPEERDRVSAVLSSGMPVANLVGDVTLRQLAALLRHARLLVSNDSGPVHVAAAVNTKTVVLFGAPTVATGPRRWGPWGSGHVVIWKPSMDAITVEEVFRAVQQLFR